MCFIAGLGDNDAFAGGEAVCLHHDGRRPAIDVLMSVRGGFEGGVLRGRDAVLAHEGLGVVFRALQLRGGLGRAENFQTLLTEIEVAGCEERQELDLALVPGWAEIGLQSEPAAAAVLVDGKPVGETPLKLNLLEGEHDLEIRAAGFKAWRTRLAVNANQPRTLEAVRLQPADGKLAAGDVWLQESLIGSVFQARFEPAPEVEGIAGILPEIRGSASISAVSTLVFDPRDPFPDGIPT